MHSDFGTVELFRIFIFIAIYRYSGFYVSSNSIVNDNESYKRDPIAFPQPDLFCALAVIVSFNRIRLKIITYTLRDNEET